MRGVFILLSWATFKIMNGLADSLCRAWNNIWMHSECRKTAYTAFRTAAIPTKLPGIKWKCAVMHFPGNVHHSLHLQGSSWAVFRVSLASVTFSPPVLSSCSLIFFTKAPIQLASLHPKHTLFCSLILLSSLSSYTFVHLPHVRHKMLPGFTQ